MSWEVEGEENYNFTCDWCKKRYRCLNCDLAFQKGNWRSMGKGIMGNRHLCKKCLPPDCKVRFDFYQGII